MSSLESIVRPYQSPQAHGTILIPATPSGSHERANITWGAKATMPTPDTGTNIECCAETVTEKSRTSDRKRITGNDGESYIDVDRANTLKIKKKDDNDCDDGKWEQMSGVAQVIKAGFEEWEQYFGGDPVVPNTNCGGTWKFKNE